MSEASQVLAYLGRPGGRRVVVERWPGTVRVAVIEGGQVSGAVLLTEAELLSLLEEVPVALADVLGKEVAP